MKKTYENIDELIEILENNKKENKTLRKEDNNPGFQNILVIGEYGVGKTYTVEKALDKLNENKKNNGCILKTIWFKALHLIRRFHNSKSKSVNITNKKMKKTWINASYFNGNEPIDQQILKNLSIPVRFNYWLLNGWNWQTVVKTLGYIVSLILPILTVTLDIKIGWKWAFVGIEIFILLGLLFLWIIRTNIISLRKIIRKYDYVIIDDLNRIGIEQKANIYNFFLCLTEDMNNKQKNLKKKDKKIEKNKKYKETRIIFIDSYKVEEKNGKDFFDYEKENRYFDLIIRKLLNEKDITVLFKEEKNKVNLWKLLKPISGYKTLLKWIAKKNNFRSAIQFKNDIEEFFLDLENFTKLLNNDERGYFISMLWGKMQNEKEYYYFLEDVPDISKSSDEESKKWVKSIMSDKKENKEDLELDKKNYKIKYSASQWIFNSWNNNQQETIYDTNFFDNLLKAKKIEKEKINNFCLELNKKIITIEDFDQFNEILSFFGGIFDNWKEEFVLKIIIKLIPVFANISMFELSNVFEIFNTTNQYRYSALSLFYSLFLKERIKKLKTDSIELEEIKKEYEKNIKIISAKFNLTTSSLKKIVDSLKNFIFLTEILVKNSSFSTTFESIEEEKNLIQENLKINETDDKEIIEEINILCKNLELVELKNENKIIPNWLEKNILKPLELTSFLNLLFENWIFSDESTKEDMICYISFKSIKSYPNYKSYINHLIKWWDKKILSDVF